MHARYTFLCIGNFMQNRQCVACGQSFQPRPQVPQQSYCSSLACQRERRRQWQHHKLQSDPDYQDNQARAQQAWSQRNPDYWHNYRATHPEYVERNRTLQQERNAKTMVTQVAKMDASSPTIPWPSGIYRLSLVTEVGLAKMDAWTVEITAHECPCVTDDEIAKR